MKKNNHLIIQWSRSSKLLWRHSDAYHPHIPTTALLSITSLELMWCNYTGEDDIRIWPHYSALNTSVSRGTRRTWPSLCQVLWITQRVWSFRTWKLLQSDLLPWEMNFRILQLIRRQTQPSIKKKKKKEILHLIRWEIAPAHVRPLLLLLQDPTRNELSSA